MKILSWPLTVKEGEISTIFSIGHETQSVNLPAYLPSGYVLISFEIVNDYYLAIYKDSADNEIRLEKLSKEFTAGVDSEDAYTEYIIVNGQPAEHFKKNNMGTLIYKYDEKMPDIISITILEKGRTPLFSRLLPTAFPGTSNTTHMIILSEYELDENPVTSIFC